MSKRMRDTLQHPGIGAKKPGQILTSAKEEEEPSCRVVSAMAPSTTDGACSTTTTGNKDGLTQATMITDTDSSIRWKRLLWICGMRVEDLVLGWFPFSDEDFAGQTCWDEDDLYDEHLLDDIWQIKHIQEIPKANNSTTTTVSMGR